MFSKAVERRRAVRYGFGGAAEVIGVDSASYLVSTVSELSRFGCFVRIMDPPFSKEAGVRLRITHNRKHFETIGSVVYTRADGMAIAFGPVSSESQAVLESWLTEARAHSTQ